MASDNKAKILRDAEKYVMQGKNTQAIAEYLKLIKSDPNDVLILNTIGDLYLRLGKTQEANRYFVQVAESYTKNNFLLKAIAVYRKTLGADPENREVNAILAGLYGKQGMNVDARNQYLKLADLYARDGKSRESIEAYERVAELDPTNSAIQLKLAEIHLSQGNKDRAHGYFVGAARGQVKSGDPKSGLESYKRASQLNPVNVEALRGFLECAVQAGDVAPVLEQLTKSLVVLPDDPTLREMLGQVHLANRDVANADRTFQAVLQVDESRYDHFFDVSRAYLERGDYDRAAKAVDTIVPILITRRETERAVEGFRQILVANPQHILSLTLLVKVYAAVNDTPRQLEALDQVAGYYLSRQNPRDALDYLEQILQLDPESDRHLRMHREAFTEAFPGTPYRSPVQEYRYGASGEASSGSGSVALGGGPIGNQSTLVEADLLINYGMRDKALAMLLALESRQTGDREVHTRLAALYRDSGQLVKAADQCMKLAALAQAARDPDGAARYRAEARQLAPELVPADPEGAGEEESDTPPHEADEIDLSGDLSEIFFKDSAQQEEAVEEPAEASGSPDAIVEEFTREMPKRVSSEAIDEQLQEVDFYIRLGFFDEARAKLNEIATVSPNHPELALRYRKLEDSSKREPEPAAIALGPGERRPDAPVETTPPDAGDIFQELQIGQAVDHLVESYSSENRARREPETNFEPEPPRVATVASAPVADAPVEVAAEPRRGEPAQVNAMFAELIDEVNSLTDQQIAHEDFETHFNRGIAYREMGLVDEAIQQFQTAVRNLDSAKVPREFIQCCAMLSNCFVEKGMPRSALRWCQSGLAVPQITPHESMALRYDLGAAHSLMDEPERALECFVLVFDVDPSYRDVARRIDDLKRRP